MIEYLQDDPHSNLLQAPKLTAHVGDPARMTNEETVQYVAALKRVAEGPPNQPTGLAFVPQVDKVHSGVRVSILSSRLNGSSLQARVVIEENRLVAHSHDDVSRRGDAEVRPRRRPGLVPVPAESRTTGRTRRRSPPRSRFPKLTAGGSRASG